MADEGGFEIGRAFVSVDPDAAGFDEKLAEQIGSPVARVTVEPDAAGWDAKLEEQIGVPVATVRVQADTTPASDAIGELESHIPGVATVTIDANTAPATVSLDELTAKLATLEDTFAVLNVGANTGVATGELEALSLKIDELEGRSGDLKVGANTGDSVSEMSALSGEIDDLQAQMDKLAAAARVASDGMGSLGATSEAAGEKLAATSAEVQDFTAQFDALAGEFRGFDAAAGAILPELAGLGAQLSALSGDLDGVHAAGVVSVAELGVLQGQLAELGAELDTLESSFLTSTTAVGDLGHAAVAASAEMTTLNDSLAAAGDAGVSETYSGLATQLGDVAGASRVAEGAAAELERGVTEATGAYESLIAEMNDMRSVGNIAFPDFGEFDKQVYDLGQDLASLQQPGGATEEALAGIQMRLTAAGEALDTFEEAIPEATQGLAAFEEAAAAGAAKNYADQIAFTAANIDGLGSSAEKTAGEVGDLGASGEHTTSIFHMFSAALTAVATNPFTWIAAATAGGILLGVELGHLTDQTDNFIATLGRQNDAAGFNVQGYQRFSEALHENADAVNADLQAGQNLTTHQDLLGASLGHAEVMQREFTGAQQAAATEADNLAGHLGSLENQYGITQTQAGNLAAAVHVSAKTLGESGDAANDAMAKINAYAEANVNATGPVGQMSTDMDVFGNDTLTATTRVDGLDQAFNTLVGNFVGAQEAQLQTASNFLMLGSDAQTAGASMQGTNQQSLSLQEQFYSTIDSIEATANSMVKAGDSTQQVTSYIEDQTSKLSTYVGGNQAAQQALQGLQTWMDNVKGAADNQTEAIQRASEALANQFIVQVKDAGVSSGAAKTDVDHLTTAIENTGTQSNATHEARAQLIADLVHAGVQASTAKADVDKFITSVGRIPKTANSKITVSAKGTWDVVESGLQNPTNNPPLTHPKAARGMLVTGGTPGVDDQLILAQKGEAVVPAGLVPAIAPFLKAHGVPGFASGGVVGDYTGTTAAGDGTWADTQWTATNNAVIKSVESAMTSAINSDITTAKAAAAAKGGGGATLHPTGSGGSVEALMQSMAASVGWTGAQWTDLYNVEMREAGFNLSATNPSSGAYGLAQFINGPSEYAQYGGNASTAAGQITGMLNYVKDRYGAPSAAWAHELQYGWYDQGGELKPGVTLAVNQTGQSEHVSPPGGGRAVNVNFYGTSYPTPEQIAALKLELGTAVGVAG